MGRSSSKIAKKINHKNNITGEILAEVKKEYIDSKTFTFDENLPPIPQNQHLVVLGFIKWNMFLKIKEIMRVQIIDLIFKDNIKTKIKFQKCEHVNFKLD